MNIKTIPIHHRVNETGELSFLEAERDIPFPIRRVYYVYNVVDGERRGFHAHKALEQCLICIHGSVKVLLDDGAERRTVELNNPGEGLYIGPVTWREMYDFSDGAVLVALVSDYYNEADYIRDYNDFIKYVTGGNEK